MSARDTASSRRRDLAFALGVIGFCALVIWEARKQPKAPFDPVGAAAVPMATAAIMIVLALAILLRLALGLATRGGAQAMFTAGGPAEGAAAPRPGLSALAIGATAAYAAAIPLTGFMAATVLFLGGLGWALSDRSTRAGAVTAAIALAGGVGLTIAFRAMLVDLP